MRAENDDPLGEYFGLAGFIELASLAAGPAGDGVLQTFENFDINVIRPAACAQEFLQAMLVIIFVGKLKHGLPERDCKPDSGATRQFVIPFQPKIFNRAEQPRRFKSRQFRSGGSIENNSR